jgi:oligopeptide transport system substrate-binding protein
MLRNLIMAFCLFCILSCDSGALKDKRTVFNYNELNGLTSLDPAAASNFENIWPVNQLFNGLVQPNDSLRPVPCIARDYSVSPDGRTYVFKLRSDVYFHDDPCFSDGKGRRVTASDFVYSFSRLFDSRVSSATGLMEHIDRSEESAFRGFEAVNDSVFRLRLKEPFHPFLNILTMKYFSVIPHEAITLYGHEFRAHPVGTGPFIFKIWEEGTRLVLLKNPNYFEKDTNGNRLPYLDAVTISFIRDRETAFMELLSGKFDMVSGADAFNANEVLDKSGELRDTYKKKFYLQKGIFFKTDYIGILVDDKSGIVNASPLRLKKVRQAINHGFDRQKLIRYLRNNIGEAAYAGFIPKGLPSYDTSKVKGYVYDVARCRQLLNEAGFPNGRGLPEMTIHTTENYKEQAEFIQSQLSALNIPVQISVEKASVLRQAVNNSEYNLFRKSWFCDYADEENFMSLFYSKNFAPHGVNFFHFKNQEFDRFYESSLRETDKEKLKALYQSMDRIILDEAPVIPLFYDQVVRLVRHNISGLTLNGMNLLNLKTVSKQPG